MYRIIASDAVLNILDADNTAPTIETHQLQIRFNFNCGCIVTQDNRGEYILNCKQHANIFAELFNAKKLGR